MISIFLYILLFIVIGLLVLGFIGTKIDNNRRKRMAQRRKLRSLNRWKGTRL
jgi:amino acid permease